MAEVQQKDSGKGGKVKQKKQTLRVDFTPMVDMNMLLITFFMFCTSLSKPQTMEIAMPPKQEDMDQMEKPPEVDKTRAVTIILDANNQAFYYFGLPDYADVNSLVPVDYSSGEKSLRRMLLGKNANTVKQIRELEEELSKKKLSKDDFQKEFKERSSKIKKDDKGSPVVMIKPTASSTYKNLIDALDEMQICNIARYAIMDTTAADGFVLKNWYTKGELSAAARKEGTLK